MTGGRVEEARCGGLMPLEPIRAFTPACVAALLVVAVVMALPS